MKMAKFMQTLETKVYNKLDQKAKDKGITIQELIRAIVVPQYLEKEGDKQ